MPPTEEVLLKLTGDATSAKRALQAVEAGLVSFGRKAQTSAHTANQAFSSIQQGLQTVQSGVQQVGKIGQVMAVVFGGIAAVGGGLIKTTAQVALRNEVLAISLYTVGRNAGYGRDELDALTEMMRELGITTSQSRLGIIRMIQGQLDLNKATDLGRAAQDLAVISGENSSETFGNMLEAIVSLQPTMLRQYGIVTTLDQSLGDLANSTDVTAKRQRFFDFVMEEAARSAGVYEEAMGVVGKQITSIPRLIEEAQAAFGKYFIPIIGEGVRILSSLLKMFERLPEPVKRGIALFILLGTALAGVIAIAGGVLAAIAGIVGGLLAFVVGIVGVVAASGTITAAFAAIGTALSAILPVVIPVAAVLGSVLVAALAALAAAIGSILATTAVLRMAWKQDWGGIRTAVEDAWKSISPHIKRIQVLVSEFVTVVGGQLKRIAFFFGDLIRQHLEPLFASLAALIGRMDWGSAFDTLMDTLNVVVSYITAWLDTIERLLRGEGWAAFSSLEDAAINGLTLVALVFDKYISKALVWGWNLIVNVANGIIKAAQAVIVKAMQFVGGIIGRFLAPGSPPKEGPLSNIIQWGKGVMETFVKAFGLADFGLMRKAIAPIRDVLESAISAGDIDEGDFVAVFGRVREQVAELIANFRDTGNISEEMLGGIAESLGEGSEEYVKFLRLQLEHQRALENLRGVEQEVEDARAAGFIPRALKERLKVAEEEAKAAEDAVSWQEEYLAMQQESIDLQLRLVEVLDTLAEALDKIAEATGAGGAEGEGALGGLDVGDLDAIAGGLSGIKKQLGEMSPEFLEMRTKIEGWIQKIRLFLTLPFRAQLAYLAIELENLTGIPVYDYLMKIFDFIDEVEEKGLLTVIKEWVAKGIEYIEDNWKDWAEDVKEFLLDMFEKAVELLTEKLEESKKQLSDWITEVWEAFLEWLNGKITEWAQDLKDWLDMVYTNFINLLTVEIPTYGLRLYLWLSGVIYNMIANLIAKAVQIGLDLWNAFKLGLEEWITNLWNAAATYTQKLVDWIKTVITDMVTKVIEKISEWVDGLKAVGTEIVGKIKTGITNAWGGLVTHLQTKLSSLKAGLTEGVQIWFAFVSQIGNWIVKRIIQGVGDNWYRLINYIADLLELLWGWIRGKEPKDPNPLLPEGLLASLSAQTLAEDLVNQTATKLQAQIDGINATMAGASMGAITIVQNFEGGLNFPNVTDGRDAVSVRRELDREATRAIMTGRVMGYA